MVTLLFLVCATYIWVVFFAHIPFVVNRTFNATPTERLQQHSYGVTRLLNCVLSRSVLMRAGDDVRVKIALVKTSSNFQTLLFAYVLRRLFKESEICA